MKKYFKYILFAFFAIFSGFQIDTAFALNTPINMFGATDSGYSITMPKGHCPFSGYGSLYLNVKTSTTTFDLFNYYPDFNCSGYNPDFPYSIKVNTYGYNPEIGDIFQVGGDGKNSELFIFTSFGLQLLSNVDTIAPDINILGDNPATVYLGESYDDAGATSIDNIDGNITYGILTFNGVDTSSTGTYPVTYTSYDLAGNVSTVIRNVDVIERKTPVLIVPGVLGTEISLETGSSTEKLWLDLLHNLTDIGDQFMDPLQFNYDLTPSVDSLVVGDVVRKEDIPLFPFDYTEGLINEFQNQGYIENTDLFTLPYDWRYGTEENNISLLKQKIQDILNQTGSDNVDIIAHSTGGLIVKRYAMEYPSDNHIGKAIFVGVPNTGAPQAIKSLIEGDNSGIPFLSTSEMKKIAQNLPVIYDLLPTRQYFNENGSYFKIVSQNLFNSTSTDLDFDETERFLLDNHEINALGLSDADNLHSAEFDDFDLRTAGIDLYAIDGCKTGTMGNIIETDSKDIFGNSAVAYNSPEEIPGDGTVPLISSTNLPINQNNKFYELNASHAKMLSQDGIRQEIVNIISSSSLPVSGITQDISGCKLNGRVISVYSPVSIDIYDHDGNHTGITSDGTSTENNIPDADFEIMGDHKFVYLPTDDNQTYDINIKGTATGTFTITDASIIDNDIDSTQVFRNIPVTPELTGKVVIGSTTTLIFNSGSNEEQEILNPSFILDEKDSKSFNPSFSDKPEDISNNNKEVAIFSDYPTDYPTSSTPTIESHKNTGIFDNTDTTIDGTSTNAGLSDESVAVISNKPYVQTVIQIESANNLKETKKSILSTAVSAKNLTATVIESNEGGDFWGIIKSFFKKIFHIK